MRDSNPGVDPYAITPESGQNKQVPDGNGGLTLRNDSGVDWFKFQEALGRYGMMGIMDLEGPAMVQGITSGQLSIFNGLGALGIIAFWEVCGMLIPTNRKLLRLLMISKVSQNIR